MNRFAKVSKPAILSNVIYFLILASGNVYCGFAGILLFQKIQGTPYFDSIDSISVTGGAIAIVIVLYKAYTASNSARFKDAEKTINMLREDIQQQREDNRNLHNEIKELRQIIKKDR